MSDRLQGFYTKLYNSEKHDSPDWSRIRLAKKVIQTLESGIQNNEILNIGSGPQALERQIWNMGRRDLVNEFNFSTLDIAKIQSRRLLGKGRSNISHTQASALSLPYNNNSFGLLVSNHAIDFLPRNAFREAYRVLCGGGKAIFNFHHPDMIPDDLSVVRNEDVREFWRYLKDNNHLFDSEERIVQEMNDFGFNIEHIEVGTDLKDKWWEVELTV